MVGRVESDIRELIVERGKITFAQFMDIALFSTNGGYYTSQEYSKEKDYYTAPAAHPIFGASIAIQLEQLWKLMGSPPSFHLLEVGAGAGLLARDILAYSSALSSDFSEALSYIGIDYQTPIIPDMNVQRIKTNSLPFRGVAGCVLSNELLDAFPVHRFTVHGSHIREIYIDLIGDEFVEVLDEPSTPFLERRLSGLGLNLPDGFRGEINLEMDRWLDDLSNILTRGFVLTFDYGHVAKDLYSPRRSRGTLRCYYRHILENNPYRRIGHQDITAHVDFTSFMRSADQRGLVTVGFTTQSEFLQNLGFSRFLDSLRYRNLSQRERDANRMGMLALIKTGEMGDFKVHAQARGFDNGIELLGFSSENHRMESSLSARNLPPTPLLSPEHIDLMSGSYPHLSWEWEGMWPYGN